MIKDVGTFLNLKNNQILLDNDLKSDRIWEPLIPGNYRLST